VLQGHEGGYWLFLAVSLNINLHLPARGTPYHDLGHCFELSREAVK
jgi:hypothetical protein